MTPDMDSAGQDAFLDIVANLVGILIILVVVVGAQAATVWKPDDVATEMAAAQLEDLRQQTKSRWSESENLRLENSELQQKHAEEQSITDQLTEIRHRLLVEIETVRDVIETKKLALSEQNREALIASIAVQSLRQQIHQVQFEAQAVETQHSAVVETIEHFPTPIARTVFSDEIHFRLLGGRVAYVPLEELVDEMKNGWELSAANLKSAENAWETVGPIGDFRLQYMLSVADDRRQYPVRQAVQLQRFVLQPVGQKIGEDVNLALREGSQFRRRLSRMNAGKTTVSFWVYPDSYEHLAVIRAWLREAGFQTASWPLEYDGLISGGPQGFRTTTN